MKVIFVKDLKNQGKNGEIKEVKDGYANNFLIKNNYAVAYNESNLNKINKEKAKILLEEENNITNSKKVRDELEKIELEFFVKTGEKDKVFGSISSKQISEKLIELGYKIDKKKIHCDNISELGYHEIKIELHKSVIANLKIKVSKEV